MSVHCEMISAYVLWVQQITSSLLTAPDMMMNIVASKSQLFLHVSDRENELKCKTVLIRKVTNFIEKNACRLVHTEHH